MIHSREKNIPIISPSNSLLTCLSWRMLEKHINIRGKRPWLRWFQLQKYKLQELKTLFYWSWMHNPQWLKSRQVFVSATQSLTPSWKGAAAWATIAGSDASTLPRGECSAFPQKFSALTSQCSKANPDVTASPKRCRNENLSMRKKIKYIIWQTHPTQRKWGLANK